ncbi:hypothetical protein PYCCODRAFT_1445566 [Trametes coccinea BRFM310]|uniref:Uncharacterized protein n=1 Tax=Trametes coccinea (strain BRFM310) TaxID=1353009 RepID=A0A1Y2INL8_TRAC3|nr:hypothetical protein PYCCODRAFT_1445566 [Trametes coccinea BRFM310]
MYSMDPRLTNIDPVDPAHPLLSSPSATSASTNASHASSPALNGVAPSYSAGSSSLASALDGMGVARSRSGSAASPAHLTSSTSDLGFPSSGSGAPASVHGSGFQFPPPGFEDPLQQNDSMQEVPGGAHLLVLGDMLKNIARTASTGSEACHMGQSGDAKEIVTLLKKNVLLVAELVSAMQLDDGSRASQPGSGPGSSTASLNGGAPSAPPSAGLSLEQSQQQQRTPPLSQQPSMTSITSSGSGDSTSDGSELSRKRCASSVAGDRVIKSMKLEPPEDSAAAAPPLQIPPAASVPPTMLPQTNFSYTYPMSSVPPTLSSVAEMAVPPPMPPSLSSSSRPPSSAGIPTHLSLGMIPEAAQPVPGGMHPALHQPTAVDPVTSLSHPTATDFVSPASAPGSAPPVMPGYAPNGVWPDARVAVPRQHHHSLSTGSILTVGSAVSNPIPIPGPGPSSMSYPTPMYSPTQRAHMQQQPPLNAASATLGRASRSHSISQMHAAAASGNPFAYVPDSGVPHPTMYESTASQAQAQAQSRPGTAAGRFSRPSSPEYDDDSDDENGDMMQQQGSGSNTNRHSPSGDGGGSSSGSTAAAESKSAGEGGPRGGGAGQRRMSRTSPSANEGASGSGSTGHGNEVPQEYRAEVERIFFEFLNAICSNLDATDSKGEPIHQTLMAKKMQRLDESPDFRPFKFRIQAFTNAFLEELARQGYPEEKIPMKKIRNFLWNQPYISRFNEEGKKSKSKGNHIWHVDAKKSGDGGWVFRPFKRKLAGTPPGVAYVGLRWTWTPRIWDPQASRANMPVTYSSPALPSWLSWKDDSLTGIPPPDAQSCDVTVEARFMQDGKEEVLTHTVHITIAPMAAVDSSFTPSRRPSLVGDIHNPRRIMSDSIVAGVAQPPAAPRLLRVPPTLSAPPPPVVAPESQVVQVLTTAAQRVAQEAQSQVVASPNEAGPELQALAKQQHVLTVTAQAISSKMAGEIPEGAVAQSNALTAAAQQVVLHAARQVVADRTVAAVTSGLPPSVATAPQVTVKEVSVATQSAVAQAVDMVGPLSSEVDVLMTAKSLLQHQARVPSALSHSTGNSPPGPFDLPPPPPVAMAPPPGAVYFPPS